MSGTDPWEVVTSLGTVGAVVVALGFSAFAASRTRKSENLAIVRRAGLIRIEHIEGSGEFNVRVVNFSDEPVFDVTAKIHTGRYREFKKPALKPGEDQAFEFRVDLESVTVEATVVYEFGDGSRWRRRGSGRPFRFDRDGITRRRRARVLTRRRVRTLVNPLKRT